MNFNKSSGCVKSYQRFFVKMWAKERLRMLRGRGVGLAEWIILITSNGRWLHLGGALEDQQLIPTVQSFVICSWKIDLNFMNTNIWWVVEGLVLCHVEAWWAWKKCCFLVHLKQMNLHLAGFGWFLKKQLCFIWHQPGPLANPVPSFSFLCPAGAKCSSFF